jgi:hypothetical protein
VIEAWDEGGNARIGLDFGRIEVAFAAPDKPRVLAEIDDLLEEALENGDAEPLADTAEAGLIEEGLIQRVAEGVSGGRG